MRFGKMGNHFLPEELGTRKKCGNSAGQARAQGGRGKE